MLKNSKLIFAAAFLILLSITSTFAQASSTTPRITAVRAQLFYDTTGKFSLDILSAKDFALWNTIIGEGSAEAPSTSTFVTVEISGTKKTFTGTKVELTATGDKGKVLLKKMVDVDLVERTKFYAPFWLYNTGCEKIKLSARLIGTGASPTVVTKIIPFSCGE